MAYSLSLPQSASDWAHLPRQLVDAVRESMAAHAVDRHNSRPELTPEQRAHRLHMEQVTRERSSATLGAAGWPR